MAPIDLSEVWRLRFHMSWYSRSRSNGSWPITKGLSLAISPWASSAAL